MSQITSWLINNWFGILGVIIGVWVSLALRPRPRLRFWTIGNGWANTYKGGSTRTTLFIRNAGNQPIDSSQWRVPLSVECGTDIDRIDSVGVSRKDIRAYAELEESNPKQAMLRLSHLEAGDEVAFEIQHAKTSIAPQLKGELQGSRDSLARGLTIKQRVLTIWTELFVVLVDYLELSSIGWLVNSVRSSIGIAQDVVFLLASTFLPLVFAPTLRKTALQHHPRRAAMAILLIIFLIPLRISAFGLAWASGLQLWYPEFMIYAIATAIILKIAGIQVGSTGAGLTPNKLPISPAISSFTAALGPTIFAILVLMNAGANILIPIGFVCILTVAIGRLDRQQLRQRLSSALRIPRGRSMLYLPHENASSSTSNDHESADKPPPEERGHPPDPVSMPNTLNEPGSPNGQ